MPKGSAGCQPAGVGGEVAAKSRLSARTTLISNAISATLPERSDFGQQNGSETSSIGNKFAAECTGFDKRVIMHRRWE